MLFWPLAAVAMTLPPPSDFEAAVRAIRVTRAQMTADMVGGNIQPSPGKGLGVFATRVIPTGTTVGSYTGEILTQRDVDARYGTPEQRAAAWGAEDELWSEQRRKRGVSMSGDYVFRVDDDIFVDAEDETCGATWTRYLNHSPEPNLQVRSLPRGLDGTPHVWFFTLRDVQPGEELFWDYGGEYWGEAEVGMVVD